MSQTTLTAPENRAPDGAVRKLLSYRWLVFSILAVAYLMVYFHRVSTAVVAPELVTAFAIDPAALGLLGSMYFYPYAFMQIPAGIMADSIGARKVVTVSFLFAGAGAFLFGLAPTYRYALAARFLLSVGLACMYIPCLRVLANWFRRNELATVIGIMFAVGNIGAISAAAPLALLIAGIGWRTAFKLVGLLTFVIAGLIYLYVRDKPQDMGFPSLAAFDSLPGEAVPVAPPQLPFGATVRRIVFSRDIWLFITRGFTLYGTLMAFQGLWGGPYLMQVYHLDQSAAGSLLMLISLGCIVGGPLSGIISDRVLRSRKLVTAPACLGIALCWLPLAFLTDRMSLAGLSLLLFALGFFTGCSTPATAQLQEAYPSSMTGTVVGINNGTGVLGGAAFQVMVGVIINRFVVSDGVYPVAGFRAAFLFCLVCAAFGATAMFFARETLHRAIPAAPRAS